MSGDVGIFVVAVSFIIVVCSAVVNANLVVNATSVVIGTSVVSAIDSNVIEFESVSEVFDTCIVLDSIVIESYPPVASNSVAIATGPFVVASDSATAAFDSSIFDWGVGGSGYNFTKIQK